jgi:4-hydroxy-tetrahydrodipicolinate synthase
MSDPMRKPDLRGVTVATVMPFKSDLSIDWDSYARILDYSACPDCIAAVFVNGHAGEGASLSDDERCAVIERTRAHIGTKPLLAGIIAHSTAGAIRQARLAEAAGAACAVLFPSAALGGGAAATSAAPVAYVSAVSAAIDIPVSIFQYPLAAGLGFSAQTLAEIAAIDGVIAIKEGSDSMLAYDENRRAVKTVNPDLAFLPSNYHWFLPQLALGGDGILSGLVSLAPRLFAELWRAATVCDLNAMRDVNDRLYPIVRAIYGPAPVIDMHTRMKVGLKALGIIAHAEPRPPLLPVAPQLCEAISAAVCVAHRDGDIRLV